MEGRPVRFVSVGKLLYWKGFQFGLQAFAKAIVARTDAQYWVIGNGPELPRLRRLAQSLGIAHAVRFIGAQPQEKALAMMADCDVLVHPSLHDSGGMVCLEAMSLSMPVICLDLGGPAMQVTNETGIKVRPTDPLSAVRDIAEAMAMLANNAELRHRMGHAGAERARKEFSWERKCEQIEAQYRAHLQPKEALA
jgi:glycosyltransferase involved in cell wall biosynthesis